MKPAKKDGVYWLCSLEEGCDPHTEAMAEGEDPSEFQRTEGQPLRVRSVEPIKPPRIPIALVSVERWEPEEGED